MKYLDREMLHGNAETLVLAILADGKSYGYQIRKELALRSRHHFQFAFGRLYPLLRSMEHRALVRSNWVKPGKAHEHKEYTITAKGLAELRERKRRWQQFSVAMNRVLSNV
ncbi:MAG: PadR family transcriptional regulator [Verrucomicrobiia bacterium]|jgi:PadR family transcriptional regulator PadR